ncbi:MAG: hypothetical protein JOZ70_14225 [Pseudolabrys sp.]|nr:hypothetical protein [Pseudolabrys sp.]MBV9956393.1 hypothetical protein [Pseudolabrys sp.]
MKFAAPLVAFGFAALAFTGSAHAAAFDGNWSVLVITEHGSCDRGYRYEVAIADGKVSFRGQEAVKMNGTVTPSGAVKVAVAGGGSRVAEGSGKLTAQGGGGTWSGKSNSGDCGGRWEAERR